MKKWMKKKFLYNLKSKTQKKVIIQYKIKNSKKKFGKFFIQKKSYYTI
jgi:hypothetical protein